MKIGFLIPANFTTGGVLVAYRQAHILAERGHVVEILFSSEQLGIEVRGYPGFKLPTASLRQALHEHRTYDAVIATWWETYYEIFKLEASHYLYFCQSDERRFYPSAMSPEVPFVEMTYHDTRVGFLTEGKWIQDWLTSTYGARVAHAPNGVDTKQFHPGVTPLAPRSAGGKVRILIEGAGSLFFKRIDLAFQVTERLRQSLPANSLEVWYVSSDGVALKNWRYDRLFKNVPHREMPAIYRSCDILLKLSSVEGVFGPPLEMMACGGTCVVSKVTGYDEYIQDGVNALAVAVDDAEAAYQALKKLIENPKLRETLSHEGLATARKLDWSHLGDHFEKGLLELTRTPSRWSWADRYHYVALGQIRANQQKIEALERKVSKLERLTGYRALSRLKHVAKSFLR